MKRGGDMKMDLEVKLDWTGGVARSKPRLMSVELDWTGGSRLMPTGGNLWLLITQQHMWMPRSLPWAAPSTKLHPLATSKSFQGPSSTFFLWNLGERSKKHLAHVCKCFLMPWDSGPLCCTYAVSRTCVPRSQCAVCPSRCVTQEQDTAVLAHHGVWYCYTLWTLQSPTQTFVHCKVLYGALQVWILIQMSGPTTPTTTTTHFCTGTKCNTMQHLLGRKNWKPNTKHS